MLKPNENLFIVDLESVSILNEESIVKIASDDDKYYKMPFLYLLSSYVRNQTMKWADKKYTYIDKRKKGSWIVYKFALH